MFDSIILIGGGNVAHHISLIFEEKKLPLHSIITRQSTRVGNRSSHEFEQIALAELYIIAVSDDAIAEVSSKIADQYADANPLVVHTSGSIPTEAIDNRFKRRGVWYPLQTFSRSRSADWYTIPMCISANTRRDANSLFSLAREVSSNVQYISDESRAALHIAAVMVNNMTNHIFDLAGDIVEAEMLDPDMLKPLIKETVSKLDNMSPNQAQTGPARRGDQAVINKHLDYLRANLPQLVAAYKALSASLTKRFRE